MTMVMGEQHLPLVYRYDHYYSPKVFIRIPIRHEMLLKRVDEIKADIKKMMLKYHLKVLDV